MLNKVIEIQHLSSGYDHKMVINDLSLDILECDFLCVNGPNGSGKTTFIKTLLGLLPVSKGAISFFRHGIIVPKLKIGYLPQISIIDRKFPISVSDVILFGLAGEKKWKKSFTQEEHEKVSEMAQLVGLQTMEKQPIGKLSGGQLQRVLLARAIISSPEVLILDEPDTYMDKSFKKQLVEILHEINQQTAIIMISHQADEFLPLIKHSLYIDKKE